MKQYDIVLKEKQLDEGLDKSEIIALYDMVSGIDVIPLEITGKYSTAMGFINLTDAEFHSYDYTVIEQKVKDILDDMKKENPTCEYEIPNPYGISTIYLSR